MKRAAIRRRPWIFPWTRAARLESKDRDALLPWENIQQALRPGPGMSYADLGAGPGVFTRKLLQVTKGEGRFMAVEAQAPMMAVLRLKVRGWTLEGLPGASRVECLLAAQDSLLRQGRGRGGVRPPAIPLPNASVDRALLIHLMHEVPDPTGYLRDLRRVLRPWGRALVVDWAAPSDPGSRMSIGPPSWSRISREEALRASKNVGFEGRESVPGFPHGWALLLKPSL